MAVLPLVQGEMQGEPLKAGSKGTVNLSSLKKFAFCTIISTNVDLHRPSQSEHACTHTAKAFDICTNRTAEPLML